MSEDSQQNDKIKVDLRTNLGPEIVSRIEKLVRPNLLYHIGGATFGVLTCAEGGIGGMAIGGLLGFTAGTYFDIFKANNRVRAFAREYHPEKESEVIEYSEHI